MYIVLFIRMCECVYIYIYIYIYIGTIFIFKHGSLNRREILFLLNFIFDIFKSFDWMNIYVYTEIYKDILYCNIYIFK